MTNSEEWSLMQKKWNQELFGNRKGSTMDKPCEREWDHDGWWCINDHTGCLFNNGHNECTHEGGSLSPLEDQNMAKKKRVIVGNHEVTLTLDEDSVDALTWAIAKAKIDTVHKYRSEQDLAILRTVVKNMYRMGLLNDKPFKG